ncbi:aspartyl protease family protein [Maribacter sp. 2307UL18-2]|uniref:aspartyl protease family protein n=1 Tax=Maribacter sp. 2307UL18-2 TaxID=3386274 RepID=UPI0039BC87F3
MNKGRVFICAILLIIPFWGMAQTFDLPPGKKHEKLKFDLINNLVIVPIEVNGTRLSFVLDTGVSTPILFNLSDKDSIQINEVSEITIRGLGEGDPIQALRSKNNTFKLGSIENKSQRLYVVLDKSLNFSPSLGIPIHGIIGYDLFRDFVVEMNYASQNIKFHEPRSYKYKTNRKHQELPLTIIRKKAYVDGEVFLKDDESVAVRMLLDTGSSDAIWLLENEDIRVPDTFYEDFLGRGLGGDVFGKRTRVKSMKLGTFALNNAKAAFPDKESFNAIKNLGNRNGSLGGEVLKRFNIIFDYRNGKVTLRKNGNFNIPFQYNFSGIDLQHDGVRYVAERLANPSGLVTEKEDTYGNVQILMENTTRLSLVPEIIVSGIRAGSPADEAGLQEGDVILAVNGKSIHSYKLQEVLQMLNQKKGKRIRVLIERYDSDLAFTFVLKDMFEKKP